MRVCYSDEMRKADSIAIEKYGIPGVVLMENAALACVAEIEKLNSDVSKLKVAIFCGKGNNGGDGFAIARHLYSKNCDVTVFLTSGTEFKGDALINFEIIERMNLKIINLKEVPGDLDRYDLIVDAIFGTGIKGKITGFNFELIDAINQYSKYTLSVDIPSGINADTGEICSVCVNADKTVTFAAYKTGLLIYPGADYTGEVVLADISIPKSVYEEITSDIHIIGKEFFKENIPKRKNNSQKGNYGKLLIIAGSRGMTGAAYLCSQAAMLCGSGLVTLAVPDCVNDILESKTTEVMTMPLKSEDGCISQKSVGDIAEKIKKCDAVLIGPGLGISKGVQTILEMLLEQSKVPVIIDADAINCLVNNIQALKNKKCEVILTPHSVEFSRISGLSVEEIEGDRLEVSKKFAKEFDVTLILKGSHSVVTGSKGKQYINITGNPGLATGGSGDVLAGITSSFVARGIDPLKAAAMATFFHGICGDVAKDDYGMESVIASNVMSSIPKAYNHILQVEK